MKKTKMIRLFIVLVIMVALFSGITFAAGEEPVKVTIDGKQIQFAVPPTIINGKTLVPFRTIFEALGAEVDWDNEEKIAYGAKDDTLIALQIGNKTAYVLKTNGDAYELTLEAAPANIKNHTMVPARVVAETLGGTVNWNNFTRTVEIYTPAGLAEKIKQIGDPEVVSQLLGKWSCIESYSDRVDSFGFYVRGSHSATLLTLNMDGTYLNNVVCSGAIITGQIITSGNFSVQGDKIKFYNKKVTWIPDPSHKGQKAGYKDQAEEDTEEAFHINADGRLILDFSGYDRVNN